MGASLALFATFLTRFVSVGGRSSSPARCWRRPSYNPVDCHEETRCCALLIEAKKRDSSCPFFPTSFQRRRW